MSLTGMAKGQLVIKSSATGYPPWIDYGFAKTLQSAHNKARKLAATLPIGGAVSVVRRVCCGRVTAEMALSVFYQTDRGVRLPRSITLGVRERLKKGLL